MVWVSLIFLIDQFDHFINVGQQSDQPPPAISQTRKNELINKRDITFGSILGFCTGFLFKKIGKMVAIAIGIGFVFLQVNSLIMVTFLDV